MFHLLDKEHEPLEHRADELIIRATGEGIARLLSARIERYQLVCRVH